MNMYSGLKVVEKMKDKFTFPTWEDIKYFLMIWPSYASWPLMDGKEADPIEWTELQEKQKADILTEIEQQRGYKDLDILPEAEFIAVINHLKARLIELNPLQEKFIEALHDYLPQGPATNAMKQALSNIPAKRETEKRGVHYRVRDRFPNTKLVEYESASSKFMFTFSEDNYKKIAEASNRQGANTRKILNFLLTKANNQNFDPVIHFDLQELVDRGIYNSKDTAYRGVIGCIDQLRSFELEGTYRRGNKQVRNAKTYVFTGRDITYTNCRVITMPGAIENLCPYFTLFPKWTYKLNKAAFSMIDHIYYMARQRRSQDSISKKGYFTVSFKTLCAELSLPKPGDTTRHTQFIINPLLDAIEEIENASQTDIKITPYYNHDYKNAHDFLDGYLMVEPEKAIYNYVTDMANSRQKKIKAAVKAAEAKKKKEEAKKRDGK